MLAAPLYVGLLLHYTRAELEIDVTTASRMLAIPLIISRNCSPQRQLSPAEGSGKKKQVPPSRRDLLDQL